MTRLMVRGRCEVCPTGVSRVIVRSLPMMAKQYRIGAGAGYSGDRIDPAVALAESGRIDALVNASREADEAGIPLLCALYEERARESFLRSSQ